jgi:hypothetical protein
MLSTQKPTGLWETRRRDAMDNTTEKTITCADLMERIADLVNHDKLTTEELASVLRLAEQMRDRRRGEP